MRSHEHMQIVDDRVFGLGGGSEALLCASGAQGHSFCKRLCAVCRACSTFQGDNVAGDVGTGSNTDVPVDHR